LAISIAFVAGVEAAVPGLGTRAFNRLFQVIGGDNAVSNGYARIQPDFAMPLETSLATYSKCGVAPRMTAPRQIMASYFFVSASFFWRPEESRKSRVPRRRRYQHHLRRGVS